MVDIDKLAAKANKLAAERKANLEAAAKEKREAVAVLEKLLEAVKEGLPAIISERIVVECTETFGREPVRRHGEKAVKVYGVGPQGTDSFEREAPITGADVFLLEDGTLLHLHYRGKKPGISDYTWKTNSEVISPTDFIEKYGARAVEVVATSLEKAMERHDTGGRARSTARHEATATFLDAMVVLLAKAFTK